VSDHVGPEVLGRLRLGRRLGGNGPGRAPAPLAVAGRLLLPPEVRAVVIAAALVRLPAAALRAAPERTPQIGPPGVARMREKADAAVLAARQAAAGFGTEVQDRLERDVIVLDGGAGGPRPVPVGSRAVVPLDFYCVKAIVWRMMRIVSLCMAPSYSPRSTPSSG